MYVLLRHPAFLILPDGTFDLTRVYVEDGKCKTSVANYLNANGRIGPATVTGVMFSVVNGLTIHTDKGHIWSPAADCQVTAKFSEY
jgi:hypothetical protein